MTDQEQGRLDRERFEREWIERGGPYVPERVPYTFAERVQSVVFPAILAGLVLLGIYNLFMGLPPDSGPYLLLDGAW